MLSDTTYLILALILFGPLFYKPKEDKAGSNKLPAKDLVK